MNSEFCDPKLTRKTMFKEVKKLSRIKILRKIDKYFNLIEIIGFENCSNWILTGQNLLLLTHKIFYSFHTKKFTWAVPFSCRFFSSWNRNYLVFSIFTPLEWKFRHEKEPSQILQGKAKNRSFNQYIRSEHIILNFKFISIAFLEIKFL